MKVNFEPCNPPLVDPLFLSNLSRLSEMLVVKPHINLDINQKPSLYLDMYTPNTSVSDVVAPNTAGYQYTPNTTVGEIRTALLKPAPEVRNVTLVKPTPIRPILPKPEISLTPALHPDYSTLFTSPGSATSSLYTPTQRCYTPVSTPTSLSPSPHRCLNKPGLCTSPDCPNKITAAVVPGVTPTKPLRTISPKHIAPYTPKALKNKSPKNLSPYSPNISTTPLPSPGRSGSSTSLASPGRSGSSTSTEKKRNERQGIDDVQASALQDWFKQYTYLTIENRKVVAAETGLPEKTVMYWFQNQRRKLKRQRGAVIKKAAC